MGMFGTFGKKDALREREGISLDADGLHVDRTWSADEFQQWQARIVERTSFGYYQQISVTDRAGQVVTTPGTHLTKGVMPLLDEAGFPPSLAGKTVLDIGCNAGFYSIAAWLRGSPRVLGLDQQPHYVNQALLVRDVLGVKPEQLEFRVADGHDLSPEAEQFDVVINTGVVYHLQNPMDFLCKVAAVTRETMILESEMLVDPQFDEYAWFIEGAYGGDRSNWWVYGPTCLQRMARAAGFREASFAGFIWKPEPGTRTPEGFLRHGRGLLICRK